MNIISIKKACQVTDKTFKFILTKIKRGITEHELSLEIQRFIRKNSDGIAFRPIVAFGKNSFEHHHKSNSTKLQKGDFIVLDFGAKVNGFCSDMTRTVFLGKANEKQKKMYQTVFEAQKRAIDFLTRVQPLLGTNSPITGLNPLAKEVDKIARDYIISKGYPTIPHGLGHGVGKRVHEPPKISPKSKQKLFPGMVFTIEPGIYIKRFGGVRIEDTFVLEKTGLRQLTHSPKTLIEIVV